MVDIETQIEALLLLLWEPHEEKAGGEKEDHNSKVRSLLRK